MAASPPNDTDALLTFQEAASKLSIPYFKIQRAAKAGLIPTYSILNSRKYVKLSDIQRAMSGGSASHKGEVSHG